MPGFVRPFSVLFDAPPHRGPVTDHFDGRRFHNRESTEHAGFGSLIKWMAGRKKGPWTRVDPEPGPPPPERVTGETCRVTFVGHATLLVQMDGMNLLTDPVWGARVGPGARLGPKRFRPPALNFDDLPPIDAVLLSHNHYDHLCEPTMRRLAETHGPVVYTGLGNGALLRRYGIEEVHELGWWQSAPFGETAVTAVPMRHFSGRGATDRDRTLWCGLHVAHPAGGLLFAGDTGYGEHFAAIRERLGGPRVALLPIGAYRPRWFMRSVHVDPAEAVQAHRDLGAQTSVAMHFGTFALADDGMEEPLRDLADARTEQGVDEASFRVLDHGIGAELP